MVHGSLRPARSLAIVLAIAGGLLAACGAPAPSALSDPVEIAQAGLTAAEAARTVHLEVTLDGEIRADPTGTGSATRIPLTGSTATADVDMAGGRAHATFAVPALLNLNGELVQIGPTSYVRTSLTGALFEVHDAVDSLPVDPTDVSGIIDDLGDLLLADGVDPVKGDDVDCGGQSCYTVRIELSGDALSTLGFGLPVPGDLPIDLGVTNMALTVRVERDTHRLAGLASVLSLGEGGSISVDVTASRCDEPMDISPPPPDQVKTTG